MERGRFRFFSHGSVQKYPWSFTLKTVSWPRDNQKMRPRRVQEVLFQDSLRSLTTLRSTRRIRFKVAKSKDPRVDETPEQKRLRIKLIRGKDPAGESFFQIAPRVDTWKTAPAVRAIEMIPFRHCVSSTCRALSGESHDLFNR